MSNSVTFTKQQIIIAFFVMCFLIALIFGLNHLDAERKYNQFIQLKTKVELSKYPRLFENLTNSIDINDTIKLKEIRSALQLINQDFQEIHYAELWIKHKGSFYLIEQHQYYDRINSFFNKEVLSQKTEKRIDYLNEKENYNDRDFFELMNENKSLNLMLKVSNNTFLSVSRYRN